MSPVAVDNPAKFSNSILAVISEILDTYKITGMVLDPFAGIGKVHTLSGSTRITIGVELEEEWAIQHPQTIHGNSLDLRGLGFDPESVQCIVTSPTYGNRMADHHNARDGSKRNTYRHVLGQELTDGSSASMNWGPEYREFHRLVYREIVDVLETDGLFVLNMKDHIRKGKVVKATVWHRAVLRGLGIEWLEQRAVVATGNRQGQNGQVRLPIEWVLVGRKDGG